MFEHLDQLLIDQGYPCRWLVTLLNHRGIGFCMRVEKDCNTGFAYVRDFLRSGLQEKIAPLAAPDKCDGDVYECLPTAATVRLVRHVAATGNVRVLMPNLLDTALPAADFGDLYRQHPIHCSIVVVKKLYFHVEMMHNS